MGSGGSGTASFDHVWGGRGSPDYPVVRTYKARKQHSPIIAQGVWGVNKLGQVPDLPLPQISRVCNPYWNTSRPSTLELMFWLLRRNSSSTSCIEVLTTLDLPAAVSSS